MFNDCRIRYRVNHELIYLWYFIQLCKCQEKSPREAKRNHSAYVISGRVSRKQCAGRGRGRAILGCLLATFLWRCREASRITGHASYSTCFLHRRLPPSLPRGSLPCKAGSHVYSSHRSQSQTAWSSLSLEVWGMEGTGWRVCVLIIESPRHPEKILGLTGKLS